MCIFTYPINPLEIRVSPISLKGEGKKMICTKDVGRSRLLSWKNQFRDLCVCAEGRIEAEEVYKCLPEQMFNMYIVP